jgi:CheY-like chemotaxis protein
MPTDPLPPKKRALVVDDDDIIVVYVSAILRRIGYDVQSCNNGMVALEMCRANPYDAVVCDIRMPKLSGMSFLKKLHLTPHSGCRVVMFSSVVDATIRREALAAGAVAVLPKPSKATAIVEAVTGIAAET